MEGFLYGLNDTDLGLYSVTSNNNESDFDLENITGKGISGGGPSGTVTEWSAARIQRVITLTILMTVSFIGNSVIIFILFCSRYHKQLNRVKIFIINLAIGDLAVCCITMSSELMFEVTNKRPLRRQNYSRKVLMLSKVTIIINVGSFHPLIYVFVLVLEFRVITGAVRKFLGISGSLYWSALNHYGESRSYLTTSSGFSLFFGLIMIDIPSSFFYPLA